LAFGIGKLFLDDSPIEQLGLFLTGCSPGGGASNIWTLTLGGNLDLSVTMTTISTLSAFVMMPAWILTLGSTIFEKANLNVPYKKISVFAVCLVIPLMIGIGVQRFAPKAAKILVKVLKPCAIFLILYIVIFAIYTNFYLLQLLSMRILIAGILLPWLGYFIGGGLAVLFRQKWEDVIAIGIETGVQNTGLAIFALRVSLPRLDADLTTVLPVAVAIMTPIIPGTLILIQKIRERLRGTSEKEALSIEQKEDPAITPLQNGASSNNNCSSNHA
jgi:sodium/bile acid cotransporter 3/5